MRCKVTNTVFDCFHDIEVADLCDCCGEPNNLRPHIVWFGEMPLYMDENSISDFEMRFVYLYRYFGQCLPGGRLCANGQ